MRKYKIFTTLSITNNGLVVGTIEDSKLLGATDYRGTVLGRTPRNSTNSIGFWRGKYLNVHSIF